MISQFTLTQAELKNLSDTVAEFTTEETKIVAIPGEVRNSGKWHFTIQVTIGDLNKQKTHLFVYRGLPTNFRSWLRTKIDKIKNE